MAGLQNEIEIEIKLKLAAYPEYLKLIGYLGRMDSEVLLLNHFFDTTDRELAQSGWAYRVRLAGKIGLVTLKGKAIIAGVAAIRPEIETEISQSLALDIFNENHDPLDIDCPPANYVKDSLGLSELVKISEFETVRQAKKHLILDRPYRFEVDRTTFADGITDYELEVELASQELIEEAQRDLEQLFKKLGIPFEIQQLSKQARALGESSRSGE